MEIFESLSTIQFEFNWFDAIISLTITTLLSFTITGVYILTHKDKGYEHDFIQTLIFLSIVVSAVMLVIGNNLAGAFGLVGAVSIIRFRTRVENPYDTAYIFFEMAVGLSCGLKQYSVAIIATLFISLVLIFFWKTNFAGSSAPKSGNILSVRVPDVITGRNIIERNFNQDVERWDIISIQAIDDNKAVINYKVSLKKTSTSQMFMKNLFETINGQLVILRYEAS